MFNRTAVYWDMANNNIRIVWNRMRRDRGEKWSIERV